MRGTPLEMENRRPETKVPAITEQFDEAEPKDALRELLLHRFARWLDTVLAEEKPLEGIAAELLAEIEAENNSESAGPTDSRYDLYSTWSSMTALSQEIKLQGRAFKHLNDKMEPLHGQGGSIDRLLDGYNVLLSDVKRIAEEGRQAHTERENKLKREAHASGRRQLIDVIIDIRDKLHIGLRSANESSRKLDVYRRSTWLNELFIHRISGINQMREIVNSLKKGYRLGIERLDEVLQQNGIHEIVCEGKPFDPRVMNAVDLEETVAVPDGTVLEVYRTGYMIGNEVYQPAQVKIAREPYHKDTRPKIL
jgi:molecular chaperone GrpE